ncbi:uncharacterized protein VTP21DRAFT_320 [Calcarisporiella thermophila]|uniref:uncharacterized protein n=1 Tax=Calcarisporiella thermophila TaxID=911321 RepID=UPI003743028D
MSSECNSSTSNEQYITTWTSTTPLFELPGIQNRVTIEKVYLNGLHALKRFEIKNTSPFRILVRLRSNLGTQVAFQPNNENLPDPDAFFQNTSSAGAGLVSFPQTPSDEASEPLATFPSTPPSPTLSTSMDDVPNTLPEHFFSIATNTVAAMAAGISDRFGHQGYQFNQLFNYVNYVDEIDIPPFQSKKVILAFLPDSSRERSSRRTANRVDRSEESSDRSSLFSSAAPADSEETHDIFEVNGLLLFYGYIMDATQRFQYNHSSATSGQRTGSTSVDPSPPTSNSLSRRNSISQERPPRLQFSESEEGSATSEPRREDEPGYGARSDYQLTVKFRSSVCRSVLWTDVGETGINFDDCVVGGIYFKDFTVWNRSEIELYWLLNTVDLTNTRHDDWLQFIDYDTGEPLDAKPIPSYSHRRIRITFRPKETGEFNYDLQVENANDASNIELVRINASVRTVLREESLVVSSGNVLDFGDCCAGVVAKQQIVLKNVSDMPLEIRFSAENAEVAFDLGSAPELPSDLSSSHQDTVSSGLHTPTLSLSTMLSTTDRSTPGSGASSPRPSSPISSLNTPHSLGLEMVSGRSASSSVAENGEGEADGESIPESLKLNPNASPSLASNRPWGSSVEAGTSRSASRAEGLQIDELLIKPGSERTVIVSYRPEKDASATDFRAGQLVRRNFRIILDYATYSGSSAPSYQREKKIIKCKARSCTSFVEVVPKEVNFGDTDVGTLKSLPIDIVNRSELTARVEIRFTSKVLNCYQGELVIPPLQSIEVKLDLYPRKVNPDYRKELTLVNLQNRDNDQIIEVRSNNIDKKRVTFHSLFYRILTPTGSNYIDFGSIILNSPAVRTFVIDNISQAPLKLELSSSLPEEVVVYRKRKLADAAGQLEIDQGNLLFRQRLLDSISEKRVSASNFVDKESIASASNGSPLASTSLKNGPSSSPRKLSSPRHTIGTNADKGIVSRTEYLDLATSAHTSGPNGSARNKSRPPSRVPGISKPSRPEYFLKKLVQNKLALQAKTEMNRDGEAVQELSPDPRGLSMKTPLASSASTRSPASTSTKLRPTNRFARAGSISAANPKSFSRLNFNDWVHNADIATDALIDALEANCITSPPLFANSSAEEKYVQYQVALRQALNKAYENGILVPSTEVVIPPLSQEEIILIYTASGQDKAHVQGIPKRQNARIFLRLVSFDRNVEHEGQFDSLLQTDITQIPVRELMLRSSLCRSIMDIGQKNINFGVLDKGEKRTKTIVIQNRSEVPLLYAIRKSGSIASGGISIGSGAYGVVRGYGKKEVEFSFRPSLAGPVHERLVIENIYDRETSQIVSVKSQVRKQCHFFIKSLELDFGPCAVEQPSRRNQQLVITNTDRQARTIVVRVDPEELKFERCFGELDFTLMESQESHIELSKEAEEEIESIEQKLKIAKRKGREDKVKKLLKKLEKLKRGVSAEEEAEDPNAPIASESSNDTHAMTGNTVGSTSAETRKGQSPELPPESPAHPDPSMTPAQPPASAAASYKIRKTPNELTFVLEPRATRTVTICFRSRLRLDNINDNSPTLREIIKGRIFVHEHKNTDAIKKVVFQAIVCYDHETYKKALVEAMGPAGYDSLPQLDVATDSSKLRPDSSMNKVEESQEQIRTETVAVLPPDLDVGRLGAEQKGNYYLRLCNQTDDKLDFEIIPSSSEFFLFSSLVGSLAPREVRRLDFSVLCSEIGRHTQHLLIRDLTHGTSNATFRFHCLIHRVQYLNFPSLNTNGELDLGLCYVDPGRKYSQVTPLLVENVSDEDIYITCQSNLSQQVCIFLDETGKRGQVVDTLLKRKSVMTVWVALRPNLLGAYLTGTSTSSSNSTSTSSGLAASTPTFNDKGASSSSECRKLVGGIKFSVSVAESSLKAADQLPSSSIGEEEHVLMTTHTVKFTSLIGQSVMSVSTTMIDLGVVSRLGQTVYNVFTVYNMSSRLPLEYDVECPSGAILVDRKDGVLRGRDVGKVREDGSRHSPLFSPPSESGPEGGGELEDFAEDVTQSSALVSFRFNCTRWGLFQDKIVVSNRNNRDQEFEIVVMLMADPGILNHIPDSMRWDISDLTLTKPTSGGTPLHEICTTRDEGLCHSGRRNLPELCWDNIPLHLEKASVSPPQSGLRVILDEAEIPSNGTQVVLAGFGGEISTIPEQCIELTNLSKELAQIVPYCNVDVGVSWEEGAPVENNVIGDDENPLTSFGFRRLGSSMDLLPNQKVHLQIGCPLPPNLTSANIEQLQKGDKIYWTGILALYDTISRTAIKVFRLSALLGQPRAELVSKKIELGKVGHFNGWRNVDFSFNVRNLSALPFIYNLRLPSEVMVRNSILESWHSVANQWIIPPWEEQTVYATLQPRKLSDPTQPGERTQILSVVNARDPSQVMDLKIRLRLTVFELSFANLEENGELHLPPLQHPLLASAVPCDAWFTVMNTTDDDVRFDIGAELNPEVSDYIKMEVLSRFSNTPLKGGVSLSPHGKIEVRLRVHPREDSRLPKNAFHLTNPAGIYFGKLRVSTRQSPADKPFSELPGDSETRPSDIVDIPIRGVLIEGPVFSISRDHIEFRSAWLGLSDSEQSEGEDEGGKHPTKRSPLMPSMLDHKQIETVVITNHNPKLPLEFSVSLNGPMETPLDELIDISPLSEEGRGFVEPGGKLTLSVQFLDPQIVISDSIKVCIQDINSLSGLKQVLTVNVSARKTTNKRIDYGLDGGDGTQSEHARRRLHHEGVSTAMSPRVAYECPCITLRGCKRISDGGFGGRYELDLGQQDLGATNIVKKLTLENTSNEPISYRVKTVNDADRSWLSISPAEGTLDPPSEAADSENEVACNDGYSSTQTITISFSAATRNIYSTYLLIESVDNPADTKTVRVTMEVVARQNIRRGIASGGSAESNRVFDVYVNGVDSEKTCIEMLSLYYGHEYTTRSMVIHNYEPMPMEFALKTNLSHDDPTEILFSTSRTSAKLFKTLTVDGYSSARVYIRFRPFPSADIRAMLANGEARDIDAVEEKRLEIYVNCRLVKDFQQIVFLKAECRMPAMEVYWLETEAFVGTISRLLTTDSEESDWEIQFSEKERPLIVCNLLDIPLEYEIVNDTRYFLMEPTDADKTVESFGRREVKVSPNIKALLKNADSLWREKYIQENVTIYNRKRPLENYWLPLRISFGQTSHFQMSSGYKSSYAFSMLENHVVYFLGDFNMNATLLLTQEDEMTQKKIADLEFQYHFIVDQLVYYGTIKTGENFIQLACLLFGSALGHDVFKEYAPSYLKATDTDQRIWPPVLAKWVSLLHYFISFFPYENPILHTLKRLHASLILVDGGSGSGGSSQRKKPQG